MIRNPVLRLIEQEVHSILHVQIQLFTVRLLHLSANVRKMLVWRILLHCCLLKLVVAFHVDQDCEVKSIWEGQFMWSEFHIKAWLPPEESKVLELTIKFEGLDDDLNNDKITLSRKECIINKLRNLNLATDRRNISVSWQEGWIDILFRVDKHYKMYLKGNASAFVDEFQVNYKPKSVQIKGNNITLNCPSDMRAWQGDGGEVIVPLDNSTHHWLSFYSNSDEIPSLTLNRRTYQLGWNGQEITTIEGNQKPLPAFKPHNFTVICRIKELVCSIQVGQNRTKLEEIGIVEMPDSFTIKSKGKFSVLLFKNDPGRSEMVQEKASGGDAAVILLILLLIAIVVGILGFVVYRKILQVKRKGDNNIAAELGNLQETLPLLPDNVDTATLDNPMLNAVINNKIHEFKNLVKEERNGIDYEMAYVEAHLLCRREILDTLQSPELIDREDLIRKVWEEYDARVGKVFEAARKGNYRRGVGPLLQTYELPATIRDSSGRSLLHIIASASDPAGGPLWNAVDVKELLKHETCFPNSVDFESKTCLHYLAIAETKSVPITTRSEQQISSEFTWQDLAKILIDFGCDPRIRDAKGQLPHELARQKRRLEMCDILERESKNFDNRNEEANFQELIKAAENGDNPSLMKFMKSYQELLPLEATTNPLTVSATRGHLETTLLLLSGGAWVCGRSAVSTTPFEAVNSVPSLPAIFPAVMRRECVDRLLFESKKIGTDEKYKKLHDHVKDLIRKVEVGFLGILNSSPDGEGLETSENARFLLCLAAQLGLSLTCQMFGFENVVLQPLPKEDKPVLGAIQNGHMEIIYLLYRDFQMSIFRHTPKEEMFSADFIHNVWTTEIKQLEKSFPRGNKIWLEQVKLAYKGSKDAVIENQVLAHIAEKGLVYIFHRIKKNTENFDVNAIVDNVTGCTMLHIAAMYGRLSMIEYLLFDKQVRIMATSKGGYTAAHLAAIRGHKQCLSYLKHFMQEDHGDIDVVTDGGHHIDKLLKGYELLVRESKLLLLSDQLGLQVWSTHNTDEKAEIMLENMHSQHIEPYNTGIREFVKSYTETKNAQKDEILKEFQGLLQQVTKVDPRYKGKVTACRSNADGLRIPMDSITIYWEVNSEPFSKYKISHERNDKSGGLSDSYENKDNKDLSSCFIQDFHTAVQNAVKDFKFKSSMIRLTYPSIKIGRIGITLYVMMHDEERVRLITVLLVPVLKTYYPKETRVKFVHPVIRDVTDKLPTYWANLSGKEWTHITVKTEDEISTRLNEEQRLVLTGCKLITRSLYSCWWFPKVENRRHSKSWQAYSVRLESVPDRVLASLFLEEVNSTKEEEWKAENYLDLMISIFRKAVTEDSKGSLTPKKINELFLDYKESPYEAGASVCSIVRFLQKRKAVEKKT